VTAFAAQRRVRASNALLGTVCFLAAEAMFFLGLIFVVLEVRRTSVAWPPLDAPPLDWRLALANTAVLCVSAGTIRAARRAIGGDDRPALVRWLAATLALGVVFVAGQGLEFQRLGGWRPGEGLYRSLFDTLVGLHAAHVLAGIALLAVVLARARVGQFSATRHVAVRAAELYWYFVALAWLALLAALVDVAALLTGSVASGAVPLAGSAG
jgi:cytochrome c oxidase subunit 3